MQFRSGTFKTHGKAHSLQISISAVQGVCGAETKRRYIIIHAQKVSTSKKNNYQWHQKYQ